MDDDRIYVVKDIDTGEYFHRLLGWQKKQSKASRFPGRDYARASARGIGGKAVRLKPRTAKDA